VPLAEIVGEVVLLMADLFLFLIQGKQHIVWHFRLALVPLLHHMREPDPGLALLLETEVLDPLLLLLEIHS